MPRLPHSGISWEIETNVWRKPWSRVRFKVGSSSAPAGAIFAAACSLSSAAAARFGLKSRTSSSSSSAEAPGATAAVRYDAAEEGTAAATSIAAAIPTARTRPSFRSAGPTMIGAISVRNSNGHGAMHRLRLTLDLGGEGEGPLSGLRRIGLDLINARLLRRDDLCGCRHLGHAVRPHIELGLNDDRARHRLSVRYVNKAHLYDSGLPGFGRRAGDFEPIILWCSNAPLRGQDCR